MKQIINLASSDYFNSTTKINLMNLPNTPHTLTEENDLIGTYPKAEAIRFFLDNNLKTLEKNNMIVLYGKWGSGKTTIMRFLENSLNKEKFHPIFFEPWKHEKDNDLTLSLLHLFMDELKKNTTLWDDSKEKVKKLFETAGNIFSGYVKSTSITIGHPTITGASLKLSGKDFLEHFEKNKEVENSFSYKEEEFRESFCQIEELIADTNNIDEDGKIIIFIDDLDRCEPEKAIELLSVIKLFFTYGKRTIFFSGVDKKAINSAIESKYNGAVESEEYLEKIYDISFNMIDDLNIEKLIQKYFPFEEKIKEEGINITKEISSFFKQLKFTNPRHIKKVLNKYEILRSFKLSAELESSPIMGLIPDIFRYDEKEGLLGDYFDTILTLYIIILFEFNSEQFNDCADYDNKILKYGDQYFEYQKTNGNKTDLNRCRSAVKQTISIPDTLINLDNFINQNTHFNLVMLFSIFTKSKTNNNSIIIDRHASSFIEQFSAKPNDYSTLFCLYMNANMGLMKKSESSYKLFNIYKMAKTLL